MAYHGGALTFTDLPHRQQLIVRLLETYRDAEDPSLASGEIPGTRGDRLHRMSDIWNGGSYAELYEILRVLRKSHPLPYWHLSERFLRSRKRRAEVPARKRVKFGKATLEPVLAPNQAHAAGAPHVGDKMIEIEVYEWDPRVNAEQVRTGLRLIDREFERRYQRCRRVGDPAFARWQPQLPEEFREHAA